MMQHFISSITGFLANRQLGALTRWGIRRYIKHYSVCMDEALLSDIKHYKCFNDFFSRQLKPGARPICQDQNIIASPADGMIVQRGPIIARQWQIKGFSYDLKELLGSKSLCDKYQHGYSVNIYLSPRDYHRVHMPYDGVLDHCIRIPGNLYTVDPAATASKHINKNTRVLCEFKNSDIGDFIVMLIGAFNVGSINTVWQDMRVAQDSMRLLKGAPLGHFLLGSSVLVLTQSSVKPCKSVNPGDTIKMGQPLLHADD